MADIKYVITVDAAGAQTAIQKFDDAIVGLGKDSGATEKSSAGFWKQVAGGAIIANATTKAISFLWGEIKSLPNAAMEAEKAQRALDSALEITGRNLPGLSRHFAEYAMALQSQTTFGDEAIKGAQTLLIQLTDLDRNGIDRATKASIGLASVMGMDLQSAASLVAKAMAGNEGALSKYNIQVSKTGTAEEKRAEILDKLGKFYGRAQADTETYSGKMAQLTNAYGDLKEIVGASITQNHFLRDSIGAVVSGLTDWLNAEQALEAQSAKLHEAQMKESDLLGIVAVNAKLAYGEMGKLIESYKGNTDALIMDIETGRRGVTMMYALKDARVEYAASLKKQEEEQRKAEKGNNTFTDSTIAAAKAQAAQNKLIKELEPLIKKADKAVEDWNKDILKSKAGTAEFNGVLSASKTYFNGAQFAAKAAGDMFAKFAEDNQDAAEDISKGWNSAIEEMIAKITKWVQFAADAYYFVADIASQSSRNQQIAMDNEYKKRLEVIQNSKTSEAEKQNAIAALDEEFAAKSAALKAKQAKQEKQQAIASALMRTYESAASTFAHFGGWPLGVVPAAIMTALGLALVAKIAAQPIPLAKGAIFKQPTFLDSPRGNKYEVAEGGEAEIISNARQLREAILGKGGSTGNSQAIRNYLSIYLDGKLMREFILDTVANGSQTGRLSLASKSVN